MLTLYQLSTNISSKLHAALTIRQKGEEKQVVQFLQIHLECPGVRRERTVWR